MYSFYICVGVLISPFENGLFSRTKPWQKTKRIAETHDLGKGMRMRQKQSVKQGKKQEHVGKGVQVRHGFGKGEWRIH